MRCRPSPWLLALIGAGLAGALAARQLMLSGSDASVFLRFGEDSPIMVEYARSQIGDAELAPGLGHDGKFFFIIANDPWLIDPDHHGEFLDNPAYRAQRILYPMLASLFGTLPPAAVVWGLLFVNVVAVGLGTWGTSEVAMRMGLPTWLGLAFPLNPGVLFEVLIDGSGALALALAMLGVAAAEGKAPSASAAAMGAAVLARETMLLMAVGVFLYSWRTNGRPRWALVAIPFAGFAMWNVWARLRLGEGLGGAPELADPPFVGLVQSVPGWLERPGLDLAVATLLVLLAVALVLYALRLPSHLTWAAAAYATLAGLLADDTWANAFDSSRALAPLLTAGLLVVAGRTLFKRRTSLMIRGA